MPSYPPRSKPVKKQDQLANREIELIIAIKQNVTADKLIKAVEKYRKAQLSLLKAKTHTFKENELRKKPNTVTLETLEKLVVEWTNKTDDEIINEVKISNNL